MACAIQDLLKLGAGLELPDELFVVSADKNYVFIHGRPPDYPGKWLACFLESSLAEKCAAHINQVTGILLYVTDAALFQEARQIAIDRDYAGLIIFGEFPQRELHFVR